MISPDPAVPQVALSVVNLCKSFGSTEVLKGISFELQKGTTLSIIGSSGSGKSTLLRCINRLETPDRGSITVGEHSLGYLGQADGRHRLASHRELLVARRHIGMVFQQFNLWPHRTVLGNVTEGLTQVLRMPRREGEQRAMRYLDQVGMSAFAERYPARLSGGQQQRVAIARALAMEPDLLLFDEATSSLDPELTAEVLAVMRALVSTGTTMIVVTHEMTFAREASDRVMFLHQGRIEEEGPPREVFARPRSERLAQFLKQLG